MPRERVAMRKVKEVLRLRYELGMSYSRIRQSCGVSLGTVNNLLARAEQAGLTTWDQVQDLSEEALEKRLYQRADDGRREADRMQGEGQERCRVAGYLLSYGDPPSQARSAKSRRLNLGLATQNFQEPVVH